MKEKKKSIQQKGGSATVKKYGTEHMSKIAKLRWEKQRNKKANEKTLTDNQQK